MASLFVSASPVSRGRSGIGAGPKVHCSPKTCSSMESRVVIFHMTAHHAFERRISFKGKIRANVVPQRKC
jgi:hypothetical protein